MSLPRFPASMSLRQARTRFWQEAGFGPTGGYDDEWQEASFGPLRYRMQNGPRRRATLALHDLHHLATGYRTDYRGESEISGWELGSGLSFASQPYAWVILLWGGFVGLLFLPGPFFRAFIRGRRSQNLYRGQFEPSMLRWSVGELKRRLTVAPLRRSGSPWEASVPLATRAGDLAAFAFWSLAALLYGLVASPLAAGLVLWASLPQLLSCPCSRQRHEALG